MSVEFYRRCWHTTVRIAQQQARRATRYRLAWLSARKRALQWEEAWWESEERLGAERYANQGKVDFYYKMVWDSATEEEKTVIRNRYFDKFPKNYMKKNQETGRYERVEPPYVAEELPLED